VNLRLCLLACAAALALTACDRAGTPETAAPAKPTAVQKATTASVAATPDPRAAFDTLVDSISAEIFRELPEFATYLGLPEEMMGGPYLGRLGDYSLSGRERMREISASALQRLQAVDPAPLDTTRRLSRQVLIERTEGAFRAAQAAGNYGSVFIGGFDVYPVTQLSGLHIGLPNLMQTQQPVTDSVQAAAYVDRLKAFGKAFDDTIAVIRADAEVGVMPPDFVINKTLRVLERFLEPAPEQNVLYAALARKMEAAGVIDGQPHLDAAKAAITDVVYPAYGRLAEALKELLPKTSHVAGIGARLPNGRAVYDAMIRLTSDSERGAEEIHAIGLSEVERIQQEMDAILKTQGYAKGSVGERMKALAKEERFLYPNTDEGKEQLLADLNRQIQEIMPMIPEWFGTVPPQPVEVRRVPAFSEASAPGGYYDLPSLDGSRPGIYWINLRDTANNPSWSLKTLTYHEAIPGHHFQIALSLDQQDIPLLRKLVGSTTAFAEGWGLYAERVAWEMGLFQDDPFGDLGRLQAELFRAVRLVVDTGMHARDWSREQAIEYMVAMGAADDSDAEIEIERYSVWPGQALGYKLGMLEFLDLRERARKELDESFDIREFHDVMLLDGGLPIPVVEQRLEEWIAGKRRSK
jgi:uncharacterized protein (DUF885 family)